MGQRKVCISGVFKKVLALFFTFCQPGRFKQSIYLLQVLPCAVEVLRRIREAVSRQSYISDDNAQSVVEICLARVLAAIR